MTDREFVPDKASFLLCAEEGGVNGVDYLTEGQQGRQQDLYVSSGAHQLPLFKGLPSMALLVDMKRSGDVEGTLFRALKVRTFVKQ